MDFFNGSSNHQGREKAQSPLQTGGGGKNRKGNMTKRRWEQKASSGTPSTSEVRSHIITVTKINSKDPEKEGLEACDQIDGHDRRSRKQRRGDLQKEPW